jgi:transcriptional regulator GlxA family with amidase domain
VVKIEGAGGVPPAWLSPLVDALAQEAFDGGPGSDLVMARLSDALLVRALRQHAETAPPGWLAALADPPLSAALSALHADPAAPWTLAALARTAGLSRATFAARFAATVGVPPMRYLLDLRMHQARTLLRDGTATVAATTTRVGYRSESAFAAAFKREVGVAPGTYARTSPPSATDTYADTSPPSATDPATTA